MPLLGEDFPGLNLEDLSYESFFCKDGRMLACFSSGLVLEGSDEVGQCSVWGLGTTSLLKMKIFTA